MKHTKSDRGAARVRGTHRPRLVEPTALKEQERRLDPREQHK